MGILELVGVVGVGVGYHQARDRTKQFEDSLKQNPTSSRDAMVLIKNSLFVRGLLLFLLMSFTAHLSSSWGNYRLLSLLPLPFFVGILWFRWPKKLENELVQKGFSDHQRTLLQSVYRLYHLVLMGVLITVQAAILRG